MDSYPVFFSFEFASTSNAFRSDMIIIYQPDLKPKIQDTAPMFDFVLNISLMALPIYEENLGMLQNDPSKENKADQHG